jgi:hypothetical protein
LPLRKIILLFGIVNASLYAALLPLWEGFDEAFHYSYIESLWQSRRFLAMGQTLLTEDVSKSFDLAPVADNVHKEIPDTTTFDQWRALPDIVKQQRRVHLEQLRPNSSITNRPNYEAHQPPLAYGTLAPVDWLASRAAITTRVLLLRLIAAILSTVMVYLGASSLCRTFGMPESFSNATLFTIFCSQMLYAAIAHVANDWLAVREDSKSPH